MAPSAWRAARARGEESLRDSIEELLEEHASEEGTPEESVERALLRNVPEVSELRVGAIRVPRTDIIAVPHDIAFADLVSRLIEAEHSRLPVYEETVDNTLGLLYSKALLRMWGQESHKHSLREFLRPAYFIPEAKKVDELGFASGATPMPQESLGNRPHDPATRAPESAGSGARAGWGAVPRRRSSQRDS